MGCRILDAVPMNIFATDQSPELSAKVLPDKHVVKMPLECCQMLSIIIQSGTMTGVHSVRKMVDTMQLPKVHFVIIPQQSGQHLTYTIRHG